MVGGDPYARIRAVKIADKCRNVAVQQDKTTEVAGESGRGDNY
jgi:hypothetical protein